jgi:hypothetical protein
MHSVEMTDMSRPVKSLAVGSLVREELFCHQKSAGRYFYRDMPCQPLKFAWHI